jgi:hypothetical protein
MRLMALILTGLLASPPVFAQQRGPSSSTAPASPATDAKAAPGELPSSAADAKAAPAALPVSLGKIREGLERPAASQVLKGEVSKALDKEPNFRLAVEEQRKIEELLATLDYKSGPTPAGGIYAFEQQRLTTPPVDNPLAQPYAAFNQGQLLTVLIENLVGKYLVEKTGAAITKSARERAEAAARKDVTDAVTEYCASKPDNGLGLPICTPAPDAR